MPKGWDTRRYYAEQGMKERGCRRGKAAEYRREQNTATLRGQKKEPRKVPFSSATRTRTGVYGVRGRCPRPLDDSTLFIYDLTIYDVLFYLHFV